MQVRLVRLVEVDVVREVAGGLDVARGGGVAVTRGERPRRSVLHRQPLVEVRQVLHAGAHLVLAHGDALGAELRVQVEELRHVRARQVAGLDAAEQGGGGDTPALLRPAEVAEGGQVVGGRGGQRVVGERGEGQVAQQRRPVQLGDLRRVLRAVDARGGARHERVRVGSLQVEGVGDLGVEELAPAGRAQRDAVVLLRPPRGDGADELGVRGRVDLTERVVRQSLRVGRQRRVVHLLPIRGVVGERFPVGAVGRARSS